MTTPPPTITGRPRRAGSSRCSTDAKKASRSACRMVALDTNTCSHPDGWRASPGSGRGLAVPGGDGDAAGAQFVLAHAHRRFRTWQVLDHLDVARHHEARHA